MTRNGPRKYLYSIVASLILVLASLLSHVARADGSIAAMIIPLSTSKPANYPTAFSGIGIGLQADYYFDQTSYGLNVGVFSEGGATVESARFKFYFYNEHQRPSMSDTESKDLGLNVHNRYRGAYAEVGPAVYQLSSNITQSNGSTLQNQQSGFGAVGAVGIEQPLFWGLYLGVRASFVTSLSGVANTFLADVLIGYPLSF